MPTLSAFPWLDYAVEHLLLWKGMERYIFVSRNLWPLSVARMYKCKDCIHCIHCTPSFCHKPLPLVPPTFTSDSANHGLETPKFLYKSTTLPYDWRFELNLFPQATLCKTHYSILILRLLKKIVCALWKMLGALAKLHINDLNTFLKIKLSFCCFYYSIALFNYYYFFAEVYPHSMKQLTVYWAL